MKIVTILSFLMLIPALAFCAPFLGCDCSAPGDGVTGASIQFDGGAWVDVPVVLTCGSGADKIVCTGDSRTFCYDLAALPNGSHSVVAKFKNLWGESAASTPPLSFVKGGPSGFPSIKIKP